MLASNLPAPPTPVSSPSPAEVWAGLVAPYAEFLDEVSSELARQIDSFEPEIAEHASYVISNPGKRLRPLLVGLAGGAHEGYGKSLVEVAVVIEMVHLATLVHDDIMDEAEVRRGHPTLASKWGNSVAVLTGDCLFAHSLKLASEFPTTDVCRAVSTATRNVCSGEIIQNNRKGDLQLAEEQYFELIRMKTGELFALACELGGSLAGADAEETQALRRYGMALGTAYQIYDDCLDLFGAEETAGKSLGTDIAGGKATLPVLLLQQQAGPEMTTKLKQMVGQWDENQLNILRSWLSEFSTLEQSQARLERYLAEALEALEVIEASAHRDVLTALTRFLAQQSAQLGVS